MKFNDNFSNCNKYRLLAMDIFSQKEYQPGKRKIDQFGQGGPNLYKKE